MAADASWASLLSTVAGAGGLALGLALLMFGFHVARRGATTTVALVILGAALMIPVAAFGAMFLGMIGAFDEVTRLGPAVTPSDLSNGVRASAGHAGLALLGCVLGLAGAVRAFVAARASDADRDAPVSLGA